MANEISVVFPYEKMRSLIEAGAGSQYVKVTVGYNEKGLPCIWASVIPYDDNGTSVDGSNDVAGCPDPPGCSG